MIKVSVPATSANLGVGYDCLGLALDEVATVYFEEIDAGLQIEGCEEAYCNEDNLIYQAFLKGLTYIGKSIHGLHMKVETNIPYARGLGSSATCIVAGLEGANAMFDYPMNKYELFHLATQLEGHPDNIAPAIFGALCVSFMEDDKPNMIKFGIKRDFLFVAMIPNYEVSTKLAREVLPTSMSYQDAIYQMGRCTALAKAFEIGNPVILKKASIDKMQEPYRKQLIPDYEEVKKISEEAGAITMLISGSGSTMMVITQEEDIAQTMIEKGKQKYPDWDFRILHASYDGVSSEVI